MVVVVAVVVVAVVVVAVVVVAVVVVAVVVVAVVIAVVAVVVVVVFAGGFGLMARLRLVALVVAVAVTAMACRMEAVVRVDLDPQGSGLVTVTVVADAAAVSLVPELRAGLLVDEIRDADWAVEGPTPRGDGGVEVIAFKRFESASQLPSILDELAGPEVIFSEVELTQDRSFGQTDYAFRMLVDPSPPLEVFSDEALAAELDGNLFGRPTEDLLSAAGPVEDSLSLLFSLTMPHEEAEFTASTDEVDGATAVWRFAYGDQPTFVSANASLAHSGPPMWMNVARAAAVAFVLVLALMALWWVIKLVRTPKGRRRRAARRRQQRVAAREAEASRPRRRLLRLLVVDAHGVIVRPTDPLDGLLLPVIQSELPHIDPDLVRDRYRKLVLGRLAADEFWSDLGLGPIAEQIETRYLSSYRLVPRIARLLGSCER